MRLMLKNLIATNLSLKIVACIIGYALWATVSRHQQAQLSYTIPLCFYNVPPEWRINAPETIKVTLSAKRQFLGALRSDTLAIHINGHELCAGTQPIAIDSAQLFLPEPIKLLHYSPSPLLINVDQQPLFQTTQA